MRSRVRIALEALLRAVALIALSLLVVHAFRALRLAPPGIAAGARVSAALVDWSARDAPSGVHVELDEPPTPQTRDWLAALARTGSALTWNGAAPAATALAVEPVADPQRSSRVWLAAPAGTSVKLRDGVGVVDTVSVARGGARVVVPQLSGILRAEMPGFAATSAVRDSLVLRPVLVLAQATWEAKFTIAALEEHGWKVAARIAVAPSGDVRQGDGRLVLDTASYAAIVATDSVAARYASEIARYVRAGGGLIAIGEAAGLAALAPVLPAVTGARSLPSVFTTEAARISPRSALAVAPLGRIDAVAVVLETRSAPSGAQEMAAAAWRVGNGRVLQIGYHDTWRWRLAGAGADPVRAHRDWWAALVSSVAYAPRVPLAVAEALEPTPLASLIGTLGPPTSTRALRAGMMDDPRLVPVLFGVLLGALLLEWASRRLAGRR